MSRPPLRDGGLSEGKRREPGGSEGFRMAWLAAFGFSGKAHLTGLLQVLGECFAALPAVAYEGERSQAHQGDG